MPSNAKQIAYIGAYNKEAYDTILVRVPKGVKDQLRQKAEEESKSLNNYIASKITEEG